MILVSLFCPRLLTLINIEAIVHNKLRLPSATNSLSVICKMLQITDRLFAVNSRLSSLRPMVTTFEESLSLDKMVIIGTFI